MIPVPPGSASRRRRGNGFTMSKLRKSIKPASMYFQCSGTAIKAIICPATSSITTKPGSLMPLSRATTVEGGIPITVTATEITSAERVSHAAGIQWPAPHHSKTVTAAAHVPDPGCKWPMPKNVAISQERRDLGVLVGDVIFLECKLQERICNLKFADSMPMMHIFAVKEGTSTFQCTGNYQ